MATSAAPGASRSKSSSSTSLPMPSRMPRKPLSVSEWTLMRVLLVKPRGSLPRFPLPSSQSPPRCGIAVRHRLPPHPARPAYRPRSVASRPPRVRRDTTTAARVARRQHRPRQPPCPASRRHGRCRRSARAPPAGCAPRTARLRRQPAVRASWRGRHRCVLLRERSSASAPKLPRPAAPPARHAARRGRACRRSRCQLCGAPASSPGGMWRSPARPARAGSPFRRPRRGGTGRSNLHRQCSAGRRRRRAPSTGGGECAPAAPPARLRRTGCRS
mmetsp:Transcript_21758/g.85029  ORF Transcript_21758/g.85029 Transcript_21758/m.85029 type:complete len:273 (+) Transcript_21758:2154-2972(+)